MSKRLSNLYEQSQSAFWASVQIVGGLVMGLMGALDISPFISLDIANVTSKQIMWIGAMVAIQGLITEIARSHKE